MNGSPPAEYAPGADHYESLQLMPNIDNYLLALSLGELLACSEAVTIAYMKNTREYIKMKTDHKDSEAVMREKLWLIVNTKSGMEKFHAIVEGVKLSTLVEFREFERDNLPLLEA